MRGVNYFQRLFSRQSVVLLFIIPALLKAEVPALEREISLNHKNEKLTVVLTKIQEQSGVIFSYPSHLIKESTLVTVQVKNKSVREVLALILPANLNYKSKNNYIILKEKEIKKNQKTQTLSGYVYDASTDKKVANVSIYDKKTLESATTNEYGYYSISVPAGNSSLTVNRINYQDTSVQTRELRPFAISNITIQPVTDSISKKDSALWQKKLSEINKRSNALVNRFNKYLHTVNISDSIERHVQISFLPFVGTNHKLSGNVYNKFSFNILGGYSRGTKEFELGGLFNFDKENVNGIQIAGLYNLVGDSMRGIQIGGLLNINGKKTNGVQIAGLMNANGAEVKGLQIAGLMNKNESSMSGLQIGGLLNYNSQFVKGTSISGLINYNSHVNGLQIAGLSNLSDTSGGYQISGIVNSSQHTEKSYAFAGLINTALSGESKVQVATLLNRTQHVGIIQAGLINISDTSSGIPVGLFSYVKKGLHQVEISADEVQFVNLNFRSGVPLFYNIISMGIQPYQGSTLWSIGYGIGSSLSIKGKLRTDVSLLMKHLSIGSFSEIQSQRFQFYWGLEYKLHKHVSLAFGPTVNLYMTSQTDDYLSISPKYSSSVTFNNGVDGRYWLGAQVSLRFF